MARPTDFELRMIPRSGALFRGRLLSTFRSSTDHKDAGAMTDLLRREAKRHGVSAEDVELCPQVRGGSAHRL
jgi:hypothetical protein